MKKLSQIIAQTGVQIYREIVPVALFSIVSSLVLLPLVFFLPIGLAVVLAVLLYLPVCTGVLYAAHRMLDGEKPRLSVMWAGTFKFFGASVVYGAMMSLFVLILLSSWWYYGGKSGMVYFSLAVFQTYFVAMAIVSQVYTLPLVVQERMNVFAAIARSVKLFVGNPLYTIGAFFQIVCLTLVLGITIVGFGCVYVGMMGVYLNMLTANLIRREEHADEEAGGGGRESRSLELDGRAEARALC
ncbi:hypothetical protein [Paenibacillus koleovorans]|uniref:hypothetical protein n=1 Tax=Paenibacillus koleovorans TaxID=121608 RepID=UPI000FD9056F|nr:hypothetical protein [Paenibacillus koleovorans]